jgi:predicted RND superfamily exporter protein
MSRWAAWVASSLAVIVLGLVGAIVDLSPEVEGDFFFAEDDPQMQASEAVAATFPAADQLVLRVADLSGDRTAYRSRVGALTDDLLTVEGVQSGFSITTDDPRSPLFARILLTPDPDATNIVLQVDATDPEVLLPRVERVVALHASPDVEIVLSGVPVIVELIRRNLYRDLVVFSGVAVLVFTLLIGLVYRDPAIVVGTLSTCFVSVGATLLAVHAIGVPIGLLTANLVTIVFVLTLSHVVFLTANWARVSSSDSTLDRSTALTTGMRETWEGSFWSMATTLLGFSSLLVASARPLRELGVAGAVGTLMALAVAYTVYPAFLGQWARVPDRIDESTSPRPLAGAKWVLPLAAVGVVVTGVGTLRLDTDPGLMSYFAEGSELREGLARIDADGGSSTLDIVVADPGGANVDDGAVFERMEALQAALEADSAVGVVLSPTVLIGHARTIPLAGLLPVRMLLNIAASDALGGVALGFVTPERDQARFSLRMRETVREPRAQVTERLRAHVARVGLEPVVVAGLYDLQAQLGRLIAASLRIGIGGLLLLFLGIAFLVSRSPRASLMMWVCLGSIPLVILGTFGHLGVAVDIITSPAANIALAIGADSMIHLVVRVRRLAAEGVVAPWGLAVGQVAKPVAGATVIICAGFGIFSLSTFPPTQRFGFAVIVGTLSAATMALVVLPRLACVFSPEAGSLSRPS